MTKVGNKLKEDKTTELKNTIERLQDKYSSRIIINEDIMNDYFSRITRNNKILKDLKEKNQRLTEKNKHIQGAFTCVYQNNKKNYTNDQSHFEFCKSYETKFQVMSIVTSDLFTKLYPKVICNPGRSKEEIYDVFSLWFIVKSIRKMLQVHTKSSEDQIKFNFIRIPPCNKEFSYSNPYIKKVLLSDIRSYLIQIYKNSGNLNEAEVFSKNFYSLYEILLKSKKLSLSKHMLSILKEKEIQINSDQSTLEDKAKVEFIKNLYGIIKNNATCTFQLTR